MFKVMATMFLTAVLIVAAVFAFRGNEKTYKPESGKCVWCSLDKSGSISKDLPVHWADDFNQILSSFEPGDEIAVYPIHDQTSTARPIFSGDVPALSEEPTADEDILVKGKLTALVSQAQEKFQKEIGKSINSNYSDIWSTIDRAASSDHQGRKLILIFFSDMLESAQNGTVNLEKTSLADPKTYPGLIEKAAKQHHWRNDTLSGATVYIVLPEIPPGSPAPFNTKQMICGFYDQFFGAIGAKVQSCDTTLPTLQLSKGSQ